jgi:hypothetical protein
VEYEAWRARIRERADDLGATLVVDGDEAEYLDASGEPIGGESFECSLYRPELVRM